MTLKRLTRRRGVAAGVAVALVAAGGGVVWMRHGATAATTYRTAAATLGTVTQSLSLTGNLAPLGESDLNLGSAGRVAAVNVQPGQAVNGPGSGQSRHQLAAGGGHPGAGDAVQRPGQALPRPGGPDRAEPLPVAGVGTHRAGAAAERADLPHR
jgi:hypothetical protein